MSTSIRIAPTGLPRAHTALDTARQYSPVKVQTNIGRKQSQNIVDSVTVHYFVTV